MSAFLLAQRRKRARARQNPSPPTSPSAPFSSANPFDDDPSDDDDAPKVSRAVNVVAAAPPPPPKSVKPKPQPKPAHAQPPGGNAAERKPSQIARLMQRHRDAQQAAQPDDRHVARNPDEAFFKAQVRQCADDATTESYRATPVLGFGESLLRNMGWDGAVDPVPSAVPDDTIVPRPDRLGLGAKLVSGAPPPPTRKRKRIDLSAHPLHINPPPSENAAHDGGIVVSSDTPQNGQNDVDQNGPRNSSAF